MIGFVIWLFLTFCAATLGAMASISAQDFYAALVVPNWAPPGWVFGPVWTFLYLLMTVSAWLVWRVEGFSSSRLPLSLFVFQLVVNALWSWFFFAGQMGAAAFYDAFLLGILILVCIYNFWGIKKLAGILLLPYLAWVIFATFLSYACWKLNPAVLG